MRYNVSNHWSKHKKDLLKTDAILFLAEYDIYIGIKAIPEKEIEGDKNENISIVKKVFVC